jgi:hypothetical protein
LISKRAGGGKTPYHCGKKKFSFLIILLGFPFLSSQKKLGNFYKAVIFAKIKNVFL